MNCKWAIYSIEFVTLSEKGQLLPAAECILSLADAEESACYCRLQYEQTFVSK